MAVVLVSGDITTLKQMDGSDTFTVSEGQALRIETSPSGEELLNITCPAGKAWTASVTVHIEEENA